MNKIKINEIEYEIISDDSKCVNKELLEEKVTDYFKDYDYIFGDFSYDKVRLKGYYDSKNKKATEINDIIKYQTDSIEIKNKITILKNSIERTNSRPDQMIISVN